MIDLITHLLLGFSGVLCHCLAKLDSLIKDSKAANVKFGIKDYLGADWLSISLSIISVIIWPFLVDETTSKYPKLEGFVNWSFLLMGFFGSYIIQYILGKGKGIIRKVVDEKTNIADNIQLFADQPIQGGGTKNDPPKIKP